MVGQQMANERTTMVHLSSCLKVLGKKKDLFKNDNTDSSLLPSFIALLLICKS